uniref:Uncharacterized protein n=1 Tax=Rhizophora mucronata TaxID=61149 RepID=A0A2P2QFU4_RHIMU
MTHSNCFKEKNTAYKAGKEKEHTFLWQETEGAITPYKGLKNPELLNQ